MESPLEPSHPDFFDFRIFICPECGNVSIGISTCLVCNSEMALTGLTVPDLLEAFHSSTKGPYKAIRRNAKSLYKTIENEIFLICGKEKCKRYQPERNYYADVYGAFFKEAAKMPIHICPHCGHIAGASCLFPETGLCSICGTPYVRGPWKTKKYYLFRDKHKDKVWKTWERKVQKFRRKYCPHPDPDAVALRIQVEEDRLPPHFESQLPKIHRSGSKMGASYQQLERSYTWFWKTVDIFWNNVLHFQTLLMESSYSSPLLVQYKEFLSDFSHVNQWQNFYPCHLYNEQFLLYRLILLLSRQVNCFEGNA